MFYWYFKVLRNYVNFEGRARRKEFWYYTLCSFLIAVILVIIDKQMGTFNQQTGMGLLGQIYGVAVFLPALAVCVRRLHDIGKSGWMVLINLIPFIGFLIFIYLAARQGDEGANEYGPDPIDHHDNDQVSFKDL